jgi:cell division protein FtsB
MSLSIFSKQFEIQTILDFASVHRNESFMMSRTHYIGRLCGKIGIVTKQCKNLQRLIAYVETPFVPLTSDIVRLMLEDWFDQTKANGMWSTDGKTPNEVNAVAGVAIQDHLANAPLSGDTNVAGLAFAFGQAAQLPIPDYKIYYHIGDQRYRAEIFSNLFESIICTEHLAGLQVHTSTIIAYAKFVYYLSASWKCYEAKWHKKMLNHLSKNQLSEPSANDDTIKKLQADVASLLKRANQDKSHAVVMRLNNRIAAIECNTNAQQLEALSQRIESLESQSVEKIQSDIDDLKRFDANRLSNSIDALEKQVKQSKVLRSDDRDEQRDTVKSLKAEVASLKATITDLQSDMSLAIDELRDECKQATSETHEFIKQYEITPIYDYQLIKARRRMLHQEFASMYKVFARLIRIHYDMPVAIAIK